MKPHEIYGHLMIHGTNGRAIAEELGVCQQLVPMVIRGERWKGPDGRRVRARIAELLELPENEIWPPIQAKTEPNQPKAA